MTSTESLTALTPANAPLWSGSDIAADDYVRVLDEDQVREIRSMLPHASRRLTGRDLDRDTTIAIADGPLPGLVAVLADAVREVEAGCGFALVRGLPVDDLTDQEVATLLRILVAHLAPIATQSRDGQLIRHVTATGAALGDTVTRGHQTSERLWFHTDGADAAVLLCRRPAADGGLSRLASAAAVHNAMLDQAPELVTALHQPFHFHMAGGHVPGLPETFVSPVFSLHRDRFSTRYVRHTLLQTPRVTGVPLSRRALAAFDLIEDLADGLSVDMSLRAGDLQIVNNHTVLHSRTAYTDPGPADRRHLLRSWLTFPSYAGRRPGAVDEGLRHGWLTDDQQCAAAADWHPPVMPSDPAPLP